MSTFSLKFDLEKNRFFTGETSELFSVEEAKKARSFHSRMAGYQPTPLASLDELAKAIGVKKILVKDESYRFGLNAFKVLGGSYAIGKLLCEEEGIDIDAFDFAEYKANNAGKMTFATATDGNHGRGVAWAARELGQNAKVYMPKGAAKDRVENIRAEGAECTVTDLNYDDAVRLACENADKHGWKVVQDTSWEGYTKIPTWIMQGYCTMADEAVEQMQEYGVEKPTHVVLQAGVGAMAGGVLGFLTNKFDPKELSAIVVEPDNAACIYASAISENGDMVNVTGDLETIMAGLACGEPNPLGWDILKANSAHFLSCEDKMAALGMRVLGNPLGNDPKVISGESGAIGVGLLATIAHSPEKDKLLAEFGLNQDSVVLLFNTEGDTDPVHYREVVWEGKHPVK